MHYARQKAIALEASYAPHAPIELLSLCESGWRGAFIHPSPKHKS